MRVPFFPARVLLQDFTGVPAVVDLAAMRAAMARAGRDPARVDPLVPCDLVIDHSVQVDEAGSLQAYAHNIEREYERNGERYLLLRWAQGAFGYFRVVPPGMGIVHQVNLEHLGRVVAIRDGVAVPDTLVGTDSHTTMINGLGVLGFGVGGIEAEAVMLGEPLELGTPSVVGVRMTGALREGVTATDLVLTLTELLRRHGVVGRFVEFCGDGLSALSLADRATLSNMSPEYGATAALFPVDDEVLRYLTATGRGDLVPLVDAHHKEQGLFRRDGDPTPPFSALVELDLDGVAPSLAGPRRPQDRVPLADVPASFSDAYPPRASTNGKAVHDGDVVIAAITSCTNTSNPSVMVAAGLLARNAVARGLRPPRSQDEPARRARASSPTTSRPPGSRCRSTRSDSSSSATAARPASATRGRSPTRSRRPCATTSWRSAPCSRATATSRAASIRWCARATWPRPRSSSPTPWRARSRSISRTSRWAPTATAPRSSCATLAVERRGARRGRVERHARAVRARVRHDLGRRRALARAAGARGRTLRLGSRFHLRARAVVLRRCARPAPLADVEDARCLVMLGDSVTTDHISPPARSRATCPPAATCSSTASSRATSTRSARAAATTR